MNCVFLSAMQEADEDYPGLHKEARHWMVFLVFAGDGTMQVLNKSEFDDRFPRAAVLGIPTDVPTIARFIDLARRAYISFHEYAGPMEAVMREGEPVGKAEDPAPDLWNLTTEMIPRRDTALWFQPHGAAALEGWFNEGRFHTQDTEPFLGSAVLRWRYVTMSEQAASQLDNLCILVGRGAVVGEQEADRVEHYLDTFAERNNTLLRNGWFVTPAGLYDHEAVRDPRRKGKMTLDEAWWLYMAHQKDRAGSEAVQEQEAERVERRLAEVASAGKGLAEAERNMDTAQTRLREAKSALLMAQEKHGAVCRGDWAAAEGKRPPDAVVEPYRHTGP